MGSLCIGTTPLRGSTLLSKSIKQFHSNFPSIEISILEKPLIELQTYVQNSECDFAISSGKVNSNLFHVEQLSSETLYLAMSPENPLSNNLKQYALSAEDIRTNSLKLLETPSCPLELFHSQKVILFEGNENITEATLQIFEELIQLPISMRVRDMYTVFSFVLANIGISLIPDTLIRYGNQKSHPDYYKINHISNNNNIIMFFKQNRSLTKASLEYCQILKALIQSGTWRQ
jgi:DNA-binding transcriptional LysR family regulator